MRWILSLVAALVVAAPRGARSAPCEAPNVLVVLDKSGSMGSGPGSKWEIARAAIDSMLQSHQARIRFGLQLFPTDANCAVDPGQLVPLALNNRTNMMARITSSGGNTPISAVLQVAQGVTDLRDATRRNFVLFITDGQQTCPAFSTPVQEVQTLFNANIRTFVIGFGSDVDPNQLNAMAQAGGTARPPPATTKYYVASDSASLTAALNDITQIATQELCDGLDNNCDGRTDEGVSETCSTSCGAGTRSCVECGGAGQPACTPGTPQWSACVGPGTNRCGQCGPEPPETCDGVDNNCNGVIDDGDALCPGGEVCLCGRCARPCRGGECSGGTVCVNGYCVTDRCCGKSCPAGWRCLNGDCLDPCTGVTCTGNTFCRGGSCVAPTCYDPGQGCPSGQVCLQGTCRPDPCANARCSGANPVCSNGTCIASCAGISCGAGQACQGGTCRATGCGDCGQGRNCTDAGCGADPCYGVSCSAGYVCAAATCVGDDACNVTQCPAGTACARGQCVSPPDGGMRPDAGAGDAGTTPFDAGGFDDAGVPLADAGTLGSPDGGGGGTGRKTGCCRVGGQGGAGGALLFGLALLTAAALGRRSRRRGDPSERRGDA